MADVRAGTAARLIGALFGDGHAAGLSDEQLLDRFVSGRDASAEAAFAALVERHGPMVLGVCRSSLGDPHEAEDAFQATFLVLARRASSVRDPGRLGPWLYGIARRTSLKARARRPRRGHGELMPEVGAESASAADQGLIRREEAEALHEEVGRLPEPYRAPVVLCYFEGLTHEEAARRLGWPIGTVGVRLMRARERLRARLTRRGVTPAGLAVLSVSVPPRAEPLAAPLAARAAGAAIRFATGAASAPGAPSSRATAIAVGVLKSMNHQKIVAATAALLTCALIAAGSAALAFQAPSKRPGTPGARPGAPGKGSESADAKSILANGGFEEGEPKGKAPGSWRQGAAVPGVKYSWDRTVAHRGRASLHLGKTVPRYFPIAQWSQTVTRTGAGPRLKVVAFVKARRAAKAVLDVQFSGRTGQETHQWAAYIGAKEDDDPPASHDWKRYEGVVAIPEGTEKLTVAVQIYGPGDVWVDDITAAYTDEEPTDPTDAGPRSASRGEAADADVAEIPSVERTAGGDPRKRFLMIGPKAGATAPAEGYRLLVLLPGGDGGAGFQAFARRIAKNALPPGYLVAEPLAVAWTPEQAERIVWPLEGDRLPGVGFSTEELVDAVIAEVMKSNVIDPRFIFTLGWSSGGPPAYGASLRPGTKVTGAFVAMSVFHADRHPSLANARGRGFYILHSPQDDLIPIGMAESARDRLRNLGATAELRTYDGGHGWHGDVYGEIRRGVEWLEKHRRTPAPEGAWKPGPRAEDRN